MKLFSYALSLFPIAFFGAAMCAADTLWINTLDMADKTPSVALIGAQAGQEANAPRIAQLQTFADGGHAISFVFRVRDSGMYDIWAATTPPVTNWASPFRIKLGTQTIYNGGECMSSGPDFGPAGNPGMFRWYRFARVQLQSGVHELTFSVDEPRDVVESSGRAFAFYLDSILITDNSTLRPKGAQAVPGAKN